jgi:hypothetical protein
MTSTVDELILAELNQGWPFSTRVYALRDVVGLHAPDDTGAMCVECEMPDPCATKLSIARGLGVLPAGFDPYARPPVAPAAPKGVVPQA